MSKTALPVRLGEVLELDLERLVDGGEAIAHHQGLAIFVPLGAPGDRVRARIISTKPSYARALVEAVLVPGAAGTPARCEHFGVCGGCAWQHLSYRAQLDAKREIVADALRRLGGLAPEAWLESTVGMADPWDYRNKVHWAIARQDHKLVIGLFEPRSHRVVDVAQCHIQDPLNSDVLRFLRETLPGFATSVYDEKTQAGWLRSAFAKVGHATGELMIGLVTTTERFDRSAEWVEALRERFPRVTSIVQNVHPKAGNLLMGDTTRVLWGNDHLVERIGPLDFAISARSFFQVNSRQVETLYALAAGYLGVRAGDRLIDAYSGTGTIALFLAHHGAGEVIGIESLEEATRDAQANARRNGITHARFVTGKVEDVLPDLLAEGGEVHGLVLDPPRKGAEIEVIRAIADSGIPRIVYVSCNPATLARDLKALCASGAYRVTRAQPVDMFPQTAHVETVVLLERVALPG